MKCKLLRKELTGSTVIYILSMFVMPLVTLMGFIILNKEVIDNMYIYNSLRESYSTIMVGEVILFLISWSSLFISMILYKYNVKTAQIVLLLFAFIFLGVNIYYSINVYKSIADIINPLLVIITELFALFMPISDELVKNNKSRSKKIDLKDRKNDNK